MRRLSSLVAVAKEHGRAVANHEFVAMLNPKFRGENFDWNNFVDYCARVAAANVYQSFKLDEFLRWETELKTASVESAKTEARLILKDSDLLSWWPNPLEAAP